MLKKIAVADLRVGMFVHEFCGSWLDHPFWRSKFLLKSDKDLQRIAGIGMAELVIDTEKGLDVAVPEAPVRPAQTASPLPALEVIKVPFEQELKRAVNLCVEARSAVMQMFSDVRMGKALEFQAADELVGSIDASVRRHPDALISLARLKTADEYTYMHSVAVAALMISLARELGLADDLVRDAGLAGLLHDIGKAKVPQALLDKPGKLTDEEFVAVRKHSLAGYEILLQAGKVSERVLDVCLHHHEKVDGTGYPHRLAGEQISLLAKMGAVCDVYDAVTSTRPYKEAWDPADALRKMAEWRGHFDWSVFQAFVKTVGIYPVGSLVRLASERLAVVIEQNPSSLKDPKVKVFFSARSRLPIEQQVIDLSHKKTDDRIVGREAAQNWGFSNLEHLWCAEAGRRPPLPS